MKKIFFKSLLFSLAIVCGLLCLYCPDAAIASGRSIVMAPMSQKIILTPGEEYKGSFTISNSLDAEENLPYAVDVSSFQTKGVDNNDNDDYGGADYESQSDLNQIVNWITVNNPTGQVAPGEEVRIGFTINVPENAPAGGQYAAFLVHENFDIQSNENKVAINEVMQMAHIIYANISGVTRETGVILDNNIPSFLLNNTLETSSMVKNTGNIHTDAEYILQVWPFSSDEEICTNEEKPSTAFVMPNTERYHAESCNLPSIGIFRAKQTVRIFGEESTVEKMVIVCPIWLLFIIIFVIAAIIIYFIAKARKRNIKKETA